MHKISIIIPVYNAEKYLRRCIDSILNSIYQHFEILLMNDGSTDDSLVICQEYAEKYPEKIRVYTHNNQGVALTRNDGIKYANGEYLMFIDNDDYISTDYLNKYYKAISDGNFDVVMGGYERTDNNNKVLMRKKLKDCKWSTYEIVSPWAKIYKSSLIKENSICFLNSNIGEDIYFNIQVVNITTNIKIIDDTGYKWFYNKASISNTIHKKANKNLQFEFLLDSILKKLKELNCYDSQENEYFFIKTICWFIVYINNSNTFDNIMQNKDYYFNWLNKNYPNYKKNRYLSVFKSSGLSIKNRIAICLLVKGEKIYLDKFILKMLKKCGV